MKLKYLSFISAFVGIISIAASASFGQTNPRYIRFSGVPNSVKGALYTPDAPQQPAHVGILVMHRASNFLVTLACTELSKRGFLVLCMNPRSDNNEALVRWETIPLDVKAGVEFLKKQPGITKIILWGFSGGGPTMTFYQNVAENGVSVCQGAKKLVPCGDDLTGLPKADGLILVDAHPGNPVNGIRSINPAVVDESRPDLLNPDLDPFNPKNGYNPKGPSSYSDEFKRRYFRAQAERMNRLIDKALAMQRQMKEGKYIYPDDDVFLIVRGDGARLLQLDLSTTCRHRETAQAAQERRHDRDRGRKERAGCDSKRCEAKRDVRERHPFSNREVVSKRQRRARHGLHGRHRSLLEQQFTALPLANDHRPDLGDGDGRSLFHSRQRDSL